MTPDAIVSIVTAALGIVAAVAPGVLAAAMGQRADEEAIAACSARVAAIRRSPALTAIDAQRVALTAIPVERRDLSPPVISPRLSLREVIRGGAFTADDLAPPDLSPPDLGSALPEVGNDGEGPHS